MAAEDPYKETVRWQSRQAGPAQHVFSDATSKISVELVQQWLARCAQDHPICTRARTVNMDTFPKRLLHLGAGDNSTIRLVDLEESFQHRARPYTALSHCWGDSQHLVSDRKSVTSWKSNIPWQSLPHSFKDAVSITRTLGLEYVWIDSLCIVQDDDEDWAMEASKMGSIYTGAYLVLSATASVNGDGGCLSLRPAHVSILGEDVNGNVFNVHVRPVVDHRAFYWNVPAFEAAPTMLNPTKRDLGPDCPLLSRAWCFQERILAKRILHYMKNEMVFECLTSTQCECGALKDYRGDLMLGTRQIVARETPNWTGHYGWKQENELADSDVMPDHHEVWQDIVALYSSKHMTRTTDILPALAGLANSWAYLKPGRYLAGIWTSYIYRGLLWRRVDSGRREKLDYVAPSWSWASVQGDIKWIGGDERSKYFVYIDLDQTFCLPARSINPYGEVTAGWLRIKGKVLRATLEWIEQDGDLGSMQVHMASDSFRSKFHVDSLDRIRRCIGAEVLCMPFCADVIRDNTGHGFCRALILCEPEARELRRLPRAIAESPHVYQRLGISEFLDNDGVTWLDDEACEELDMYLI